jgi:4'-phosphopantetheinyl transferase
VELWTIPLARPCPTFLSENEEARASRFRFDEDRIRWIRARSSLRLILSKYAGCDPGALAFASGPHGKPALVPANGIEFNLSHAGDWAVIAVSRSIPVGVDIERLRLNVEMAALLHRLGEADLPDSDLDLYRRWTRREAKSKASGGALFDTPAADIHAVDIEAPAGYAGSVALVGCEPVVRYQTID